MEGWEGEEGGNRVQRRGEIVSKRKGGLENGKGKGRGEGYYSLY
jgi:hypothetical protein